jgi:predicted metal-dependent phosphotriesterase family hydrolase
MTNTLTHSHGIAGTTTIAGGTGIGGSSIGITGGSLRVSLRGRNLTSREATQIVSTHQKSTPIPYHTLSQEHAIQLLSSTNASALTG